MEEKNESRNLFAYASRRKLRWPFRGSQNLEDLWDLSLNELDEIYKKLRADVKNKSVESLLSEKSAEDEDINVRIDIVKYIVDYKLNEIEEKKAAREKAEKRRRIIEAIAKKENENLEKSSLEELRKELEEME